MKKITGILMSFLLILSLASCTTPASSDTSLAAEPPETEWAIYWYLCGSNLEDDWGAATDDLQEMLAVQLPENVKLVIQTGGSNSWNTEGIDPEKSQRFLVENQSLTLLEEQEKQNMGESETLRDFLQFASENYPAERTMALIWNHGGGSLGGAAYDQQFSMDGLTLSEMREAFTAVFDENAEDQPLDIIGFDACLMASIDTAFVFSDIAQYLVASEETEPGDGWEYEGWMSTLAQTPDIDALPLAQSICDSYMNGLENSDFPDTVDSSTLSVINLSKAQALFEAYDAFGRQALESAVQDPAFLNHFGQTSIRVEHYGDNTRWQGYTDLVDLGDLATKTAELLPEESAQLLAALEDCVEYNVSGIYHPHSMGISAFYPFSGLDEQTLLFSDVSASEAMAYYFEYSVTGTLSESGMAYIEEMGFDSLPEIPNLNNSNWRGHPLTVNEDGYISLTLGEEAQDILSSVSYELFYRNEEENILYLFGVDNDLVADWDAGVFEDNFRGVWGSIDGTICFMELTQVNERYNYYSVPILLNDELCSLSVVYDFELEEFFIEGIQEPADASGAANRNLLQLQEGDVLVPLLYAIELDAPTGFNPYLGEEIIVTEDTSFYETPMENGEYILRFVMEDSQGRTAYSGKGGFTLEDGEITAHIDTIPVEIIEVHFDLSSLENAA